MNQASVNEIGEGMTHGAVADLDERFQLANTHIVTRYRKRTGQSITRFVSEDSEYLTGPIRSEYPFGQSFDLRQPLFDIPVTTVPELVSDEAAKSASCICHRSLFEFQFR